MKVFLFIVLCSSVMSAQQGIQIGNFTYGKSSAQITDSVLNDTVTVEILKNLTNKKEALSCSVSSKYYTGKMTLDPKRKTAACRYYYKENAPSKSIQDSTQVFYRPHKNGLFLYSHGYHYKNGRRKVAHFINKEDENKARMDSYLSK